MHSDARSARAALPAAHSGPGSASGGGGVLAAAPHVVAGVEDGYVFTPAAPDGVEGVAVGGVYRVVAPPALHLVRVFGEARGVHVVVAVHRQDTVVRARLDDPVGVVGPATAVE